LLFAIAMCGTESVEVVDFDGNCDGLGGPGAIVGVDTETGALRWERTVGDATGVALAEGVVAGAGQSGAALGVDAAMGDLLWCEDFGRVDQQGSIVQPGFAASSGVLATAVAGGDVVGLDPRSGRELWRTTIGVVEGLHVEPGAGTFRVLDHNGADPHLVDLDAMTGDEVEHGSQAQDDGGYTLRVDQPDLEGLRQEVDVAVERGGRELWSERLPGFVVALRGDVVVVIDQTGGTGVFSGSTDTRVSAYEASTGAVRWQVPLPGTPHLVADAGPMFVIPTGTVLYAIDVGSGEIVWESDAGSPGRGGRYSTPGTFRFVELDDSTGTLVGLVVAEEPYRD
jgi:outer membrane protein assembly factor BamB